MARAATFCPRLLQWTLVAVLTTMAGPRPSAAQERQRLGSLGETAVERAAAETPLPSSPDPIALQQAKHTSVDTLTLRVADQGRLRVIVGVNATFVPEGRLAGEAVAAQRASIQAVHTRVLERLPVGSISEVRVFDAIPYFAAEVDATGLRVLDASPDVTSVQEDHLDPPALATSTGIVGANAAWTGGFTGTGWAVAVLDTGVERTHPFLSGKIVSEACYSSTFSSSFASSVCPGGANSVASGSAAPCTVTGCYHGTHVAGIAAGRGASFSGVARDASLIAIQVFSRVDSSSSCGATTPPCALSYQSDRILGMQRVLALRTTYNIASVNMSIGGGYYSSQASCDGDNAAEKAAIDNLRSVGIATTISSGNDGYSFGMGRPGCISSAISVASTTKSDAVSSFSNTASFLNLLAPGSSINSSLPGATYGLLSGTSMAAPHVAGAWAILRQAKSSATVTDILTALRNTGPPIADPISGISFPRIKIDSAAAQLLGTGTAAPGAPTGLTAIASGSAVLISWVAPATGGPPTGYTLEAGSAPGLANLANFGTGSTATSFTTSGVGAGIYYIRVRATNSAGASAPSNEAPLIVGIGCSSAPGAPSGLTIVSNAGGTVVFAWTAASGTPMSYVIEAGSSPGASNIASSDLGGTATTLTVGGVGRGTYYVRVRAKNNCGTGPASNEVVLFVQ